MPNAPFGLPSGLPSLSSFPLVYLLSARATGSQGHLVAVLHPTEDMAEGASAAEGVVVSVAAAVEREAVTKSQLTRTVQNSQLYPIMKRLLPFLLLISQVGMAQTLQEYVDQMTPQIPIADVAGLLTEEEENQLREQIESIEEPPLAYQICLLESLGGFSPDELAREIRETWKVGGIRGAQGVLLLATAQEGVVHISTGAFASSGLPDALLDRIVNVHMVPKFERGKYYEGLEQGISMTAAGFKNDLVNKRDIWLAVGITFIVLTFIGLRMIRRGHKVSSYSSVPAGSLPRGFD